VSHRGAVAASLGAARALEAIALEVISCQRCPRLRSHCEEIARVKRRAYRDQEYWGRPVPSFGEASARLLVIGLAPAAHGANRTGRVFTGDDSGDWLYRAMHAHGFASQPVSRHREDGLELRDAYILASAKCAPPDNKPTPEELRNCRDYFERELELLTKLRVVVALGRIAFDSYLGILQRRGIINRRASFAFGHNVEHDLGLGQPVLISSYHPSRQNTQTGRLTDPMLAAVFERARSHLW
jgi:uracil-DNA glycosylase